MIRRQSFFVVILAAIAVIIKEFVAVWLGYVVGLVDVICIGVVSYKLLFSPAPNLSDNPSKCKDRNPKTYKHKQ